MSEYTPEERRRLAAYSALSDAGVSAPGPKLADLADTVLVEIDDIDLDEPYPEDRASEIADSAVPVYTAEILEAMSEDAGLATWEPEVGPAFDGTPTPVNIAAGVLYDLASAIAHNRLAERQREAEEAEDGEEDES